MEAVLWKKKSSLKEAPEANVLHLADSHPYLTLLESVALFRLLFNEEICSLIACETERYASQRNEVIHLTPQEIEAFVGILLLTEYNSRPRQRLYWSKVDDISCPLISRSMSRKRFEDIRKLIHFADHNNLPAGDKLAKIRPLQDRVNASLQQFRVFAKDLVIDKQMVPHFGRHSAKTFIRGKPIRFGYKNWVLASSDGYPYKFETYTGACDTKDSSKPLGPQVVSALLSIVENPVCHCVYFDNFFTYYLLRDLHKKNFRALGTIRDSRTMKCPLRPSKSVKKEEHGFFDHRSNDHMSIVQWKNNKVVYFGSNFSNIEPIKMVKRYSQREKKKISGVQPFCFYQYN